jgi:hypothetical protein
MIFAPMTLEKNRLSIYMAILSNFVGLIGWEQLVGQTHGRMK